MRVAIIGYGRMGKAIQTILTKQGHRIGYINNGEPLDRIRLADVDVAIEFSRPESAFSNIEQLLRMKVPVVCGTTGWLERKPEIELLARELQVGFLYASNFSLGVNIFFVVNEQLARLMAPHKQYNARVHEIHHTGKLDAPSGTAITAAEAIIESNPKWKGWTMESQENNLPITADRIDPYCGTHSVFHKSEIDTITLTHEAHSRDGFATGAIVAAQWLIGKGGVFTMRDVLGL